MAAYVIVDIEVRDPEMYEQYKKLAADTVVKHGGRYIVRGGRAERLEGDWRPNRIVVLEFPTYERAKEWWASSAYRDAATVRQACAAARMLVVEGM
jgi:uncharacterized protein (DUF1330 family)